MPLNFWPLADARFQSGEGDRKPEQGRKDHHGDGEQRRREQEQRPPSRLAANQHLPRPEGHGPHEKGVERRPPVLPAELEHTGAVEDLDEHDERKQG